MTKKIYLSVLALSVGTLSFAQELKKRTFEEANQNIINIEKLKSYETTSFSANKKAGGDTLWFEDFENGLPAGWSTVDNNANSFEWYINSGLLPTSDILGDDWDPLGTDTIEGNYMMLPSDYYNTPTPAVQADFTEMDAYFQTSAIALNNIGGVSVTFKQDFIRCCAINPAPETILSVSRDPVFSPGILTQEYDIIGGVAGNSRFNGETTINISEIAANYTGDIYLRFHVRSGTILYYWTIDDIALVQSQDNDITTSQASYGFYGVEYTRLPANHIRPADFSMASSNIGALDQTGSQLRVRVNDGTSDIFTASSADTTLNSLSVDTLELPQSWIPPATPLNTPYTITLDILSDFTDATPENNEYSFPPLEISANIMALDDYGTDPTSTEGNNGGEYEIGNQFDATVDDELHAIEMVIGDGSTEGGFFDLAVYQRTYPPGAASYFTELWRSGDGNYEITSDMIGTATTFALRDPLTGDLSPLTLYGDSTYMVVAHNLSGLEYATSGSGPLPGTPSAPHSTVQGGKFSNPQADTRYSVSTAMIRLNFDETVGINQANATTKFNVYPNPSNGIFSISLDADLAKTVNLSVKNVVGQTIINKTINVAGKTKETLSLADYSKGVYFLTIDKKTVKVIVE